MTSKLFHTFKSRNLFREFENLVTPCSLRLGFDLLREKNCIELLPILWHCKVCDRENLAGSAPQYPHFANHLIQKKESISRLLGICDSGGGGGAAWLSQTLKALCDFCRMCSHHTHR